MSSTEDTLKCKRCGKIFATKSNLNKHFRSAKYCIDVYDGERQESYPCVACKKSYTQKATLQDHVTKCAEAHRLEVRKLHKKIKLQQKEITKLTEKVNELNDQGVANYGNGDVFRHPKLKNVFVGDALPLTSDAVRAQLYKFTYDEFIKGYDGIKLFVLSLTTTELGGQNYVCTDTHRCNFYRLAKGNVWKKDRKGMFIETILHEMRDVVTSHYDELCSRQCKNWRDYEAIEELDDIKRKVSPMYYGVTGNDSRRDKLFMNLRRDIKNVLRV